MLVFICNIVDTKGDKKGEGQIGHPWRLKMEKREEKQLSSSPVPRKEQEEKELLPLESLDVPINQLLKIYKRREAPRRWKAQ